MSLGLVGLLFMLVTPLGLAAAWWHPAFRDGKRRDPLLVLCVLVYISTVVYAFAFFED